MDKRSANHLTCFSLALALILGGSTVYYAAREKQYEAYVTVQNRKNLSQLLSSVDQLATSLKKASYLPEGAMRQTLAADIWKESQLAASALAALPLGDQPLEQIESYISKTGDYAYYLMRVGAYDRADTKEWETLCELCQNADKILLEINTLKEEVDIGSSDFRSITASSNQDAVSASLSSVNDEFPEYASLIYDGPYSDHITQREANYLEGKMTVTREDAQQVVATLLSASPDQVTFVYESDGQIPCYGFRFEETEITITKQGGLPLSYSKPAQVVSESITTQQAVNQAAAFLEKLGYQNLQHSYFTVYENTVTINFHATEGNVLIYPDLIKIGVSLANGEVVHMDASGYLMNHTTRELTDATFSQAEAEKIIPQNLKLLQTHQVYIPTTGYHEVLCWELVCENENGAHVLLYLNCQTGQVENLLLLIESENGTLTR